ncbi:MAG: aa3-type cytochrome c oxidase subunit IV [Alphaproteobacteria bacterium]|nr:aa3-type cytochrome c oxidase subunit IV [Alphaproteobacteria bacterium]
MSDWHNAEHQNLGTYRGFIRMSVVGPIVVVLSLIIMAITLV